MPLTAKGKRILAAMKKEYGDKKGEQVFYASKHAGKIKGVEGHSPLHRRVRRGLKKAFRKGGK